MDEDRKSFEQLVEEKATCGEFAWNGFIRLYEKDEKVCECRDCVAITQLNDAINKVMRMTKHDNL